MSAYIPDPLYKQICEVMPIPCVDIVVRDKRGRVLLLKRRNEPARDQWWFPGGRVHYGEQRCSAAIRKLMEECGLPPPDSLTEIATLDLTFPENATASNVTHHAITTLFEARLSVSDVVIDAQSSMASWRMPSKWLQQELSPFVKQIIEKRI